MNAGNSFHAYDIFQWGIVAVWLVTGRRVTIVDDMKPFASDPSNAPSMNFIFGTASATYRAQQREMGKGGGSCARGALELGAQKWHEFLRTDVLKMLKASVSEDGVQDEDVDSLMNLLLDPSDRGLLSAYLERRPHGADAAQKAAFCRNVKTIVSV
eukprot:TRINITY_DN59010_c0_g1_i1.p2 TRINITY_DN59010_c0_g1~~TRINITY_DN59010_c0_g1_i1.p2  ORF type:complete len:156 (-),score=24.78 TRINITY_DN59010_c0_g1_i1:241-708(-)